MPKPWPLNDAKTHLSKVIDQAQEAPQVITRHGRAAAVVLSVETFEALTNVQSAWDVLRPPEPMLGPGEDFERLPSGLRTVALDD